jgi:hypothetical protein
MFEYLADGWMEDKDGSKEQRISTGLLKKKWYQDPVSVVKRREARELPAPATKLTTCCKESCNATLQNDYGSTESIKTLD